MSKIILHNGKTVFWNGKTFTGFVDYTYSGRYLIDFGTYRHEMNGNWNNITSISESLLSMIDNSGKTSTFNVNVVSGFTAIIENGDSLTGTTYPTKAIVDGFYTTGVAYYSISGLNNDNEYDFNFFGMQLGESGTTKYSIGNNDVYLDNYENYSNIVTIPNNTPTNNEIVIKIERVDGVFGILSVLDITEKTPIQYDSSSIDSIKIIFESIPTSSIGVIKTPFRYDKQYAYSYSWDDGVLDQYTYGFKYSNGGIAGDSNYYSGKTYTDGYGNEINFNVGLAIFSINSPSSIIYFCNLLPRYR